MTIASLRAKTLLDLDMIVNSTFTTQLIQFCPLKHAQDVAHIMNQDLSGKQLRIEVTGSETAILGDQNRFEQVLLNMLSQAISRSKRKGTLQVSLQFKTKKHSKKKVLLSGHSEPSSSNSVQLVC